MKNKVIIGIISILILTILLIGGYQYLQYTKTDYYKLSKVGYNHSEINQIKKLNQKDIDTITKVKYDRTIPTLIAEPDFQVTKFKEYHIYQKQHKLTAPETIFIINNELEKKEAFDQKKTRSYMAMANENKLSAAVAMTLVNADVPYSKIIPKLQQEQYYIEENLLRYINYYEKTKKEAPEIIQHVNSKIDHDFYTNVVETDTGKQEQMLVNKFHRLNEEYVPSDLITIEGNYTATKQTTIAYQKMKADAAKQGLTLQITSAYRSYQTQDRLYQDYKANHGEIWADQYSARPGYSEHQTGLALDILNGNSTLDTFGDTKEAAWLKENCQTYGFILRYEDKNKHITGYQEESWHFRYVGVPTATKIKQEKLTYEEYYAFYIE